MVRKLIATMVGAGMLGTPLSQAGGIKPFIRSGAGAMLRPVRAKHACASLWRTRLTLAG